MGAISFFSDKQVTCPSCKETFKREILRSGGGRLIAKDLKPDLRRTYKVTEKFGKVIPLYYNIVVCPHCLYAALPDDFLMIKEDVSAILLDMSDKRRKYLDMLFKDYDFSKERNSITGAASFFLAISCYSHFDTNFGPTTKKAICSIRASWMMRDLNIEYPNQGYDNIYLYYRRLAAELYEKAIASSQDGSETFDNVKKLGPDIDTDYGYDGALYLMAYLGDEQMVYHPDDIKLEKYKYFRSALAKVFGFGKSSKEKPSPLLTIAKDLHHKIGIQIQNLS